MLKAIITAAVLCVSLLATELVRADNTFEILSYQDSDYRFLIVPRGATPPTGFEQLNFDDTAFQSGSGAFGSGGHCALQTTVQTPWPTNSRLLLRRIVSIPPGATQVEIRVSVDNEINGVFFNGARVQGPTRHDGCSIPDQLTIHVPQQLVRPGQNLVVFDVLGRGIESFFDARILTELRADVLSNSLLDLGDVINRELPKVPVSSVKATCPPGSRQISLDYSVDATGSRVSIDITQMSMTDFTARVRIDDAQVSTIERRGTTRTAKTSFLLNNENDILNAMSVSQVLGSPSAVGCLIASMASTEDESCESTTTAEQCGQCCVDVGKAALDRCASTVSPVAPIETCLAAGVMAESSCKGGAGCGQKPFACDATVQCCKNCIDCNPTLASCSISTSPCDPFTASCTVSPN